MSVRIARPDVADVVLRSYGRSLHPELFGCHGQKVLVAANWRLHLQFCEAGHLVMVQRGKGIVAEAITERQQLLPLLGRLIEQRLRGCRTFEQVSGPLRYSVSCQLERLDSEVFRHQHDELSVDCLQADLARVYPGAGRLSPGPISLLRVEATKNNLSWHAFHTFPESLSVVKTQTLVEILE